MFPHLLVPDRVVPLLQRSSSLLVFVLFLVLRHISSIDQSFCLWIWKLLPVLITYSCTDLDWTFPPVSVSAAAQSAPGLDTIMTSNYWIISYLGICAACVFIICSFHTSDIFSSSGFYFILCSKSFFPLILSSMAQL